MNRRPEGRSASAKVASGGPDAGKLGMWILIASLSMLFAATLVAYVIVRSRAAGWPPAGAPRLPLGLWLATAVAIVISVVMESGLRGIRRGETGRLRRAAYLSFVLALAFLVVQAFNWRALIEAKRNLYGFTFYMLTGLHAAHVLGGLIPLGIVASHAKSGEYSHASHAGVLYCTMYWEFLAVAWVVIFAALHV